MARLVSQDALKKTGGAGLFFGGARPTAETVPAIS
jgi:hypothetical protein